MKTIDFSYFIERYNAGEMSESERQWFQKELEGNKKLQDEVNLRKNTDLVLKNKNILELRNKLTAIEKRRVSNVIVKNAKRPYNINYAAVVVALVMVGSAILFTRKNPGSEEVLNRYYEVYDPPANQRSGQTEENEDFALALEFYNTHDYEKAAVFFNKVLTSNPKDMQSTLLNGVSNFEGKKYPEAQQSFVKVIDDNNNLFIEAANWYLALCYIKTDETDKAINLLQMISKEGGRYSNSAKKIVKKLK